MIIFRAFRLVSDAMGRMATRQVASSEPEYKLSATELSIEYQKNRLGADSKYKNRVVEVRGEIHHIGDAFGAPYIMLETDSFCLVQCLFDKRSRADLAQMSGEEFVVARGKVSGWHITNVVLDGCVLKR